MTKVTASEFQKKFGEFKEKAQREPIQITSNGRESVVLISAESFVEYQELKNKYRYAYGGKVTKEFEQDIDSLMTEHKDVLEGLAK